MQYRLTALMLLLAASSYGAEVTLDSGTAKSSEPVALNVHLSSSADALTGLQFDLQYDASALDVSVEIGPSADAAGKILQTARTPASGQRILIVGFNQKNLADGVIAILHVSVKDGHGAEGEYPIRVTGLAGTNAKAESIPVSGRHASLKVLSFRNSTR
jgi:hypothetical protein